MLSAQFKILAVAVMTMLGCATACKASDVKFDLIGKIRVDLSDLDLQKPTDARLLVERLNDAAYRACGGDPRFHDRYQSRPQETVEAYRECRENAVERAVNQIGGTTLVQAYAESRRKGVAMAALDQSCSQ